MFWRKSNQKSYKKIDDKKGIVKIPLMVVVGVLVIGIALSACMHAVIQKSFFQAAVTHEIELIRIMELLGSQLTDSRLYDLKAEAENTADQYSQVLLYGSEKEKEEALSAIKLEAFRLNYCYQTKEKLFCGRQFHGTYAAELDLSEAWEGKTVLFSPDFDAEGNYILAIAVPVWKDQQKQEIGGIMIEQLDGYCISDWIGDLFLSLNLGTAYIIDETGRNIATAREENYDWITTRYNSQELVKKNADESTKSVARLEKYALDGKTGVDTYIWEGSTNYVAYGPLEEADWGFCVGFYGDAFKKYTREIASVGNLAAGIFMAAITLFLGTIIAIVLQNLNKERKYSEILRQQKTEIEQQAMCIVASEERFRVAMERSRDIILEYQIETGEISCFHGGREIKSGRLGEEALRKRLVEDCCMDENSFVRFQEVLLAIGKGVINAECIISGNRGQQKKWYSMSVSAIPNTLGVPTRAVGVLRDVTGEHEAELDLLTRLLNKTAMTANVKEHMKKSLPYTSGAFVMLDIDYFKKINDQYGHPAGDQVLCAIADILRELFPEPYLIGRFGGDEFSIYCPSKVDLQELKKRLWQLSKRAKKIQLKNGSIPCISLSIGAVVFQGAEEFEKIYEKADEMLYQVKKAGRDGCRIFEIK